MKSFNINGENNLTAFASGKEAEAAGGAAFRSEAELHLCALMASTATLAFRLGG